MINNIVIIVCSLTAIFLAVLNIIDTNKMVKKCREKHD